MLQIAPGIFLHDYRSKSDTCKFPYWGDREDVILAISVIHLLLNMGRIAFETPSPLSKRDWLLQE
jgi:hypothetical protein